jgi:hypothetical protein
MYIYICVCAYLYIYVYVYIYILYVHLNKPPIREVTSPSCEFLGFSWPQDSSERLTFGISSTTCASVLSGPQDLPIEPFEIQGNQQINQMNSSETERHTILS